MRKHSIPPVLLTLITIGTLLGTSVALAKIQPIIPPQIKDSPADDRPIILKEVFSQEKVTNAAACGNVQLLTNEFLNFYKSYTALEDKKDWLLLVDPKNVLSPHYKPNDLVTISDENWPKPAILRKEAADQMMKMIEAAKKENVTLIPLSTYRTWQYQAGLHQRNLAKNGGIPTGYVARAGESQHHLGTAVDFNTLEPTDENIPALVWLREHAGEYGFSLSFPKGAKAEKESGYPYEPWHYRYITPEAVTLQNQFFKGNQHKTLSFLQNCVFKDKDIPTQNNNSTTKA